MSDDDGLRLVAGQLHLRRAAATDYSRVIALQQAAYARNRVLLGVDPLPLQADYAAVFSDMEVWLAERDARLRGALILEQRASDMLNWSIA